MTTPSPTRPAPAEARHALIIEDDLVTGLDLQAMLQPLGYASFAFASTAEQAREQARLQAPDLATIDLGLLDGDGLAAAKAVREVCGADPTILFITGDPEGARDHDASGIVLGKPITALDLQRALSS